LHFRERGYVYAAKSCVRESGDREIPRKPSKRKPTPRGLKAKPAVRIQYGALPYRLTEATALEILLVTTRQSKRWIIPKGWPIKGLKPPKSAAREAFEEAGVRGRVGAKAIGVFAYNKLLDDAGIVTVCEVKVFPLLVTSQSQTWPEVEQRTVQWVEPGRAVALVNEAKLKELVAAFAKKAARAAS